MNGRIARYGGLFGLALLGATALGTASCEEGEDEGSSDGGATGGGIGETIARQCGIACPAAGQGLVAGNAAISGYTPIDGFFRSVLNFSATATGVSDEIDGELRALQSLFNITEAQAQAGLAAAIRAKLETDYKIAIQVTATPARCAVDAKLAARATVECQAKANCNVDPGKATFNCEGTCTVEASAQGRCAANADLRCEVTGPEVSCNGQCSGTCTVEATGPGVACSGNCVGTCSAACMGDADPGPGCNGQCMGMCSGRCEVTSPSASAMCTGKCNGSCEYTAPSGMCDVNANASCDLKAEFKAQCNGRCEGDFEPPKVDCEASASCEASAQAEARFQVQCTPPSLDVRFVATGGGSISAEATFALQQLRLRLPTLKAVVSRANYVNDAGIRLGSEGRAAISATLRGFTQRDIGVFAAYRIATCVPDQLEAATTITGQVSAGLKAKIDQANAVGAAFGMVM